MTRPRCFDVDTALQAALHVFWKTGFEGASLTELTHAMGITRPSLYATFGNKEALFRKALDRYRDTCMHFFEPALAEPTARGVAEKMLYGYADAQTSCTGPAGCLTTSGALACSDAAEPIRRELAAKRDKDEAALRTRFDTAMAAGDLPHGTDTASLAGYIMAVVQGMAVQASSGASRETLYGVVKMALRAWPT